MQKTNLALASCGTLFFISLAQAKPWKSGEILTHDRFRFGAFEARIKASAGSSAISAFYLLKDNSWEEGQEWQELDFEVLGKESGKVYQTQIMTPGSPRVQNNILHPSDSPLSEDFHVYRIEWTPDSLSFYLDGKFIRKENDLKTYAKFLEPQRVEDMRLRISLWGGFSEWSGQINPQQVPSPLWLDWVKVYNYESDSKSFTFAWMDDFNSFDSQRWSKADWTFDYAINDFTPAQVSIEEGNLKLEFAAQ